MGRPVYKWVVIYEDGSTESVEADNILDALEKAKDGGYEAISVMKLY